MKILCFEIGYVGFGNRDKGWKQLTRDGHYLDAIRQYRKEGGLDKNGNIKVTLSDAKRVIDDYLARLEADNG